MNPRLSALLWGLVLLTGCPIGDGKYLKPKDLPSASLIDKLRILAIVAEPPEARPGEEVAFSALVTDPQHEGGFTVWLVCSPSDLPDDASEDDTNGRDLLSSCLNMTQLDPANFSTSDLAGSGVIGFEPGKPPRYTVPENALDHLDEAGAINGIEQMVQMAVLPEDTLSQLSSGQADFDGFDFNDVEAGFKRFLVSRSPTPNHNPVIGGLMVDGYLVHAGETVEVDAGQRYNLGLYLPASSIESYVFISPMGETEVRREEPYVTWYTDAGELHGMVSGFPFLVTSWTAPEADAEQTSGQWWAVVRDRRGGMSWMSQPWRLRGSF